MVPAWNCLSKYSYAFLHRSERTASNAHSHIYKTFHCFCSSKCFGPILNFKNYIVFLKKSTSVAVFKQRVPFLTLDFPFEQTGHQGMDKHTLTIDYCVSLRKSSLSKSVRSFSPYKLVGCAENLCFWGCNCMGWHHFSESGNMYILVQRPCVCMSMFVCTCLYVSVCVCCVCMCVNAVYCVLCLVCVLCVL